MDSTKSIRVGVARFFSGTMLSRLTGLVRDLVMAASFGSHPSVAAFLVSLRLSHLFRRLLGEGALHAAFVPQFEQLRREDSEKAGAFFRDLALSLGIVLFLLVLLGEVALISVLSWVPLSEGNREIIQLTAYMLPSLLFICLYGLYSTLLHCEKSFFLPAMAPAAFNLAWIVAAWWMASWETREAMPWLAGAVVIGCCLQWLVTMPRVLGILRAWIGQVSRGVRLFSPDVKAMRHALFLGILGVGAVQVNSAIDYLFARWADPSGPAYLWYALRIQQLPIGLFGVGMAGALLPPLSRAIKAGEVERFQNFLHFSLRQGTAFILPFSVALGVGGLATCNLLYGRGDYTTEGVVYTTYCLWAYSLGMLPTIFVMLLAPAFYAQQNYRIPTIGATCAVGLNIGLNTVLIFVCGLGASSVALATSVSALFNMAFLMTQLRQRMPQLNWRPIGRSVLRLLAVSGVAAGSTAWLGAHFLGDATGLIAQGVIPELTRDTVQQVVHYVGMAGVYLVGLVLVGWLGGVRELQELVRLKPVSAA